MIEDLDTRGAEADLTRALQDAFKGCRLCGFGGRPDGEAGVIVNTTARNDADQTLISCERCSFVQQLPMPTERELWDYYASGQYRREFPPLPIDGVQPDAGDRYEEAKHNQALDSARYLAMRVFGATLGQTLLEVGCGEGRVAAALSSFGYDVYAYEADPAMAAIARDQGVKVVDAEHPDAPPYTIVYAMQVLEHQSDPIATLKSWHAKLAPGGRVHVQVPTIERMYGGRRHFFQKPHVVNFTSRTLTAALIRSGFERVTYGIQGAVLWATAYKSESPAPSYEAIESALDSAFGPKDDVLALIEKHESEIEAQRAAERAARGPLSRYADGEDVDRAELLPEIERMADTIDMLRAALGKMSADLDEKTKSYGETYASDPFLRGFAMGKSRQCAVIGSAISALANGLVVRMLDHTNGATQ